MYSITAARPLKKLALREFCFDIHKFVFYCIFIQLISRHKRNKKFGWHRHIWAGKTNKMASTMMANSKLRSTNRLVTVCVGGFGFEYMFFVIA